MEGYGYAGGGLPSTDSTKKKTTTANKKRTPSYFHVFEEDPYRGSVYEPEADSFLLLDALDADREYLRSCPRCTVLEVGPGSGLALTHLACHILCLDEEEKRSFPVSEDDERPRACVSSAQPVFAYAVDVNPNALAATKETWQKTLTAVEKEVSAEAGAPPTSTFCRPSLELVRGDLLTMWRQRHRASKHLLQEEGQQHAQGGGDAVHEAAHHPGFDVILFNPPYVPTSMEELERAQKGSDDGSYVEAAWSGGPDGRVILDRFLRMMPSLLSPDGQGVCYVIAMEENHVTEMIELVQSVCPSIDCKLVAMRYTGERLRVVRFTTTVSTS